MRCKKRKIEEAFVSLLRPFHGRHLSRKLLWRLPEA